MPGQHARHVTDLSPNSHDAVRITPCDNIFFMLRTVPSLLSRANSAMYRLTGAGDRFHRSFPRAAGFPVRPFAANPPALSVAECRARDASRERRSHDEDARRNFLLQTATFAELGLSAKVQAAIQAAGYTEPTPIQVQAIPVAVTGRDVLGIAQTGTGKTAGFVLPMLARLETGRARARMPRSLILAPTRELAAQVEQSFEKYGINHKLTRRAADRRASLPTSSSEARPRRRRADRHAGAPARSLRARQDPADRRRDPRHRRSRPHARHGLHSRHRENLQAAAAAPADAVLLGHHAARDPAPGRYLPQGPRAHRGHAARHGRRHHHPALPLLRLDRGLGEARDAARADPLRATSRTPSSSATASATWRSCSSRCRSTASMPARCTATWTR